MQQMWSPARAQCKLREGRREGGSGAMVWQQDRAWPNTPGQGSKACRTAQSAIQGTSMEQAEPGLCPAPGIRIRPRVGLWGHSQSGWPGMAMGTGPEGTARTAAELWPTQSWLGDLGLLRKCNVQQHLLLWNQRTPTPAQQKPHALIKRLRRIMNKPT